MPRATLRVRNGLTFLHKWLGVLFCGLFTVWFASGLVMMYWPYPRIDAKDRLARAGTVDGGAIQFTPEQAFARLADRRTPNRVVLSMLDGRPAYRLFHGNRQNTVFADTGELLATISEEMGGRIAAAMAQQPVGAAKFEGTIREADQWTVNGTFRAHGPLLKYTWPDGQEVYVSPGTAEAVQHTTRGSRIGAYFGAIPHWIYFTPLRKNSKLWNAVVVWSSGIGTVVAILGMIVGLWRYSPFKGYRLRDGISSVPYIGQKRWHAILGLIFGTFACTWVFSGMMSMDPVPALNEVPPRLALRAGQVPPAAFAARHPREVLAGLPIKEVELLIVAGEAFYLAVEAPGVSHLLPVKGELKLAFDQPFLLRMVTEASRPYPLEESRLVTEYESYYVDRHGRLPLPALFVRLNDPGRSMYYIDPRTARVVASYNTAARWNRWLYQGLHSMDLPWLYRHRPIWDFAVLTLLAGGAALCFTSLVIGWRVLRTGLSALPRPSSGLWRARG